MFAGCHGAKFSELMSWTETFWLMILWAEYQGYVIYFRKCPNIDRQSDNVKYFKKWGQHGSGS